MDSARQLWLLQDMCHAIGHYAGKCSMLTVRLLHPARSCVRGQGSRRAHFLERWKWSMSSGWEYTSECREVIKSLLEESNRSEMGIF